MTDLTIRYSCLQKAEKSIETVLEMMEETYQKGGKIMLCGNGGSCSDCDHIVGELMKGFCSKRSMSEMDKEKFKSIAAEKSENFTDKLQYGVPAISLVCNLAVNSAFNNDVDPELVYAQQVWGLGSQNDLVIGISTSGNSKNVINALITAKAKNIKTVGLTGKNECLMDQWCDCVIHAPETETYKIQELHLPIYHYLCLELEKRLFG